MKKLANVMLALVVVFAINACKNSGGKPESVAEKWLKHMGKKEYAEAKKLSTPESETMINMMIEAAGKEAKEAKEPKLENMKAEMQNDTTAIVTYTADGKDEKLKMVKRDGKWLVHMSKEESFGNMFKGFGDNSTDSTQTPAEAKK